MRQRRGRIVKRPILPREKPPGSTGSTRPDPPSFREAWRDFVRVAFLDPICEPVLKVISRAWMALARRQKRNE